MYIHKCHVYLDTFKWTPYIPCSNTECMHLYNNAYTMACSATFIKDHGEVDKAIYTAIQPTMQGQPMYKTPWL